MRPVLLAVLLASTPAAAGDDVSTATPHAKVQLVTDVESAPAGSAFRAGVRFKLDPGWHIYWQNPGQAGLATKLDWEGVDVVITPRAMPAPTRFNEGASALTTYGYANEVVLIADAKVAGSARKAIDLVVGVEFLICEKECIPGRAALQKVLPVGPVKAAGEDVIAAFDASQRRIPLPSSPKVTASRSNVGRELSTTILVAGDVKLQEPIEATFLPDVMPWSDLLKPVSVEKTAEGIRIQLQGRTPKKLPADAGELSGLLALVNADGLPWWASVRVPVEVVAPTMITAPPPPVEAEDIPLMQVLLMALLGGIILNLMPCVFPVLALKVYAFATVTQQDRRHVALHAIAYTGGIVGSMLVLASVVIGLRAAGHSVGWGFQFQEPLFVAIVTGVIFALALNLFGVFEVMAQTDGVAKAVDGSSGLSRSAGEGVLAVLLSTPCSAPFLGTAVGFALARPAGTIVSVFVALGVGLALPFVALVLIPGVAKLLPKPGPWMDFGKQLLGFALMGTGIWLLWVLGQLTGVDGMMQGLVFLTAIAFASWLWGKAQFASINARVIVGLVNLALVGGVGFKVLPRAIAVAAPVEDAHGAWEKFDEDAIAHAVADGHPVFVDFTADWCLTCKANERMVIATSDVQAAFTSNKVRLFKADWTKRDEEIHRVLQRHGKAGVPMYLLYSPKAPKTPVVLPEVLTVSMLVEKVGEAAR